MLMDTNLAKQAVEILRKYCEENYGGNKTAMSKDVGINATSGLLGKWFSGERTPSLSLIAPALQKIGVGFSFVKDTPLIQRAGRYAPIEPVEGENLPLVPVYGSTGAGPDVELFNSEPETFIQVLPQYMLPDLAAFRVDGDSMEPTIKCGSYVGVVPFNGDIAEGGIYLVSIPPFGRLIKRLKMGVDGGIDLVSDNKSYEKRTISYEGYDKVVLGRVAWVWQLF